MSAAASAAAGRPVLVYSFDEWRDAARDLLRHQVAPHEVQWLAHRDDGDLFAASAGAGFSGAPPTNGGTTVAVPIDAVATGRDLTRVTSTGPGTGDSETTGPGLTGEAPTGVGPTDAAMPTGLGLTGAAPTGEVPIGAVPTGSGSDSGSGFKGATPTDPVPTDRAATGIVPTSPVPTSPVPAGHWSTNAEPAGAVPTGAATTGPVPSSPAPTGATPMSAASVDVRGAVVAPSAPGRSDVAGTVANCADNGALVRVPRQLMDMLQCAACCRVPHRWAFLYLVLWRWQHGEKAVLSPADEDGARLHGMVKAVKREEHDMHAYIRFRERREDAGPPRFVAWFEPAHDVLPQVARHFASRMGRVTWMIATPDASVMWDGATLHSTGPLMRGPEDIDDAGEALWLTYYRSIFNPARLNADLMHGHIPSRFWKNLPEGSVVPEMVSQAAAGARKVGQTASVGKRGGTAIPVAADKARPERQQPSTLDQCRRCDLWQHATQAVGGVGPDKARIMLVGEQPGDQEDLAGLPFVGPAGQLLDRAMAKAALERRTIYLTSAVKHFKWEPRGKRRLHKTPAQREIDACSYWLDSEIAQVNPNVIVAMGSTALKAVVGDPHATLKDVMGKPILHGERWIVAVYHPSYVLRVPGDDAKAQAFAGMVDGLREAKRLAGG